MADGPTDGRSFPVSGITNARIMFTPASKSGDISAMKQLLQVEGRNAVNVHENKSEALREICKGSHHAALQLLLSLDGERRIEVHDRGKYARLLRALVDTPRW